MAVQSTCSDLCKRNMRNVRNVDKEKHLTGACADVPLTYERDGNYERLVTRSTCLSLSTLHMLHLRKSGYIVLPRCEIGALSLPLASSDKSNKHSLTFASAISKSYLL